VSVGDDHACALDAAGRAYCWGNNHAGQLGARTPIRCGIVGESGARSCYPTANDTLPLPAGGTMRFVSISAGRYLTCGIDAEGRAFCWGQPLGDTAAYHDQCLHHEACSFTPVALAPERRFAAVDVHARCAAAREGTALCWGHGYRQEAQVSTPWRTPVAAVAGDPETHAFCAVGRDAHAYCQGDAAFGVPGHGGGTTEGGPVDGDVPFAGVAVLGNWVCGVDAEGTARCWGAAGYGEARRGETRDGFEQCEKHGTQTWCNRRPVAVAGVPRLRSVTAMPRGTLPVIVEMVGLTAAGEAYVWGGDRVARRWRPERRWASVSAGDWGQCGVTTGGELVCWGRNPHEEVQGRIPHPR
jgi:alpha-tubulin suppressor-like RCC1 family protein